MCGSRPAAGLPAGMTPKRSCRCQGAYDDGDQAANRSDPNVRVMIDKTQSEHNKSALPLES